MSKKIKQDYEEQKRQAAENNAINQIETFHAESMTMEAHKSKMNSIRERIPETNFHIEKNRQGLLNSFRILKTRFLGFLQYGIFFQSKN
jgi:hypothetical protein